VHVAYSGVGGISEIWHYTKQIPPKKRNSSFYLPPLIQIDEEHYIITETGYTVSSRHSDDKCKQVINKRIECLKEKLL